MIVVIQSKSKFTGTLFSPSSLSALSLPMELVSPNNEKIYNLTAGRSMPEWAALARGGKSLKHDSGTLPRPPLPYPSSLSPPLLCYTKTLQITAAELI